MKKLLTTLLVLVLALGCALPCLAEEENTVMFAPTLANGMQYSAEDWYVTSQARATLTVLLVLETTVNEEAQAKLDVANFDVATALANSYVGINDDGIMTICVVADTAILSWIYSPQAGIVSVFRTEVTSGLGKYVAEETLKQTGMKYEANLEEDLVTVLQLLTSALSGGN